MKKIEKAGPKGPATANTANVPMKPYVFDDGTVELVPLHEVLETVLRQNRELEKAKEHFRMGKDEASDELRPAVEHGQKFKCRKEGSISPVRKFVRAYVKKHPSAKPAEVRRALIAKPPRGVEYHEASGRVAAYITTPGWPDVGYHHFQGVVAEERLKLRS
jgi:hypothetical protein